MLDTHSHELPCLLVLNMCISSQMESSLQSKQTQRITSDQKQKTNGSFNSEEPEPLNKGLKSRESSEQVGSWLSRGQEGPCRSHPAWEGTSGTCDLLDLTLLLDNPDLWLGGLQANLASWAQGQVLLAFPRSTSLSLSVL